MTTKDKKNPQKPELETVSEPVSETFSPSEFMRARRPELFSDSKLIGEPRLTSEVFEYQLHLITKHKKEIEFEHFCRRIAEKEVCPNLIPQTGPTGGGDSKVDTETYPVADQIALRWYEGVGRESSQERWAFAFSAKEKWRPKVKADVEKIVNTKRGYKLAYFITNQFIKDKTRADVEEELQEKYKIQVRILDGNWIVRKVFEHNRVKLAIEALGLTDYDEATKKVVGPQDLERESELQELEEQINEPNRYQGVEYQLAEDCLKSALLARGLELPRIEVDGRFDRAARIAERVGLTQQQLRIVYNKAWTVLWWYDDFSELNKLYDQVESLAIGSMQTTDLELLANLWTVLYSSVSRGQLDPVVAKIDARTETLKNELERLAAEVKRPNNSLRAQTRVVLIDMHLAISSNESLSPVFIKLKEVLAKTNGLSEYPVEPLIEIIKEVGEFVADTEGYDELFELVVKLIEHRASKRDVGRVLLERGYQKLNAGKTYDAIRFLGRAQQKLAMHEYRKDWVSALFGCAMAYERAGLLWAARANILMAANQAFSDFWKQGKVIRSALACLRKLIWLELQLGRVPYVLAWIETTSVIAQQLNLQGGRKKEFLEEREMQDMILGLLLLKTDIWELKWLDFLPELLDELELHHSWMALLYALGYEEYLRSEKVITETQDSETVKQLFTRWLNQPANTDLPEQPEFLRANTLSLRSNVLGCEIIAETPNNLSCIYLTETILGALESLLATSLEQVLPYEPKLRIVIKSSDFISGLPQYSTENVGGEQRIVIKNASDTRYQTLEEQEAFRSWLFDFLLKVITLIAVTDAESFTRQQIIEEQGVGRALNFSEVSIAIENILGESPKILFSDWESKSLDSQQKFKLQRDIAWNHDTKRVEKPSKSELVWDKLGEGEPPPELLDLDKLKHKNRQVYSLINIPLWDKAEWQATAFGLLEQEGSSKESPYPPMLALGFKNHGAARKIFEDWRVKLGKVDAEEQLHISIITGIDKVHPASYSVVISMNPKLGQETPASHFLMVSRSCRMDQPNPRNLDKFLREYKRLGAYWLMPAYFERETEPPRFLEEVRILKRELRVVPAWQLGENDPDISAIDEDDTPIIPEDVKDAPIIRALKAISKRRTAKPGKRTLPSTGVTQERKIGRNEKCWCGSGKKYKNCHAR